MCSISGTSLSPGKTSLVSFNWLFLIDGISQMILSETVF